MPFLVSKWFGIFVLDETGNILKKSIFKKDLDELLKKREIRKNKSILEEEKDLAKEFENIFVFERRLAALGMVIGREETDKNFLLPPQDFGFSLDLLHELILSESQKNTYESLSKKDLQLIQMVNAFDDLTHILNLIFERKSSWEVLPNSEEMMNPLLESEKQIEQSMQSFQQMIEKAVDEIAPNIGLVVGPFIGARLIAQAGGLNRLALMSSSTIQMLGAEKALFRFKKEGGKPPKHGIIFQHAHICRSPRNIRGRIARAMAAKISLAAKADAFTKNSIGEDLRNDLDAEVEMLRSKNQ